MVCAKSKTEEKTRGEKRRKEQKMCNTLFWLSLSLSFTHTHTLSLPPSLSLFLSFSLFQRTCELKLEEAALLCLGFHALLVVVVKLVVWARSNEKVASVIRDDEARFINGKKAQICRLWKPPAQYGMDWLPRTHSALLCQSQGLCAAIHLLQGVQLRLVPNSSQCLVHLCLEQRLQLPLLFPAQL